LSGELRSRYGGGAIGAEREILTTRIVIALSVGIALSLSLSLFTIHISFSGGVGAWLGMFADRSYWFFRTEVLEGKWLTPVDKKKMIALLKNWNIHSFKNSFYGLTFFFSLVSGVGLSWHWMRKRSEIAMAASKTRPGEHALVSAKELGRVIKTAVRDKTRPHAFRTSDLVLGREKIRVTRESIGLHLGLAGASQSGKTNAINQILSSRREHKEKALIVDPNGEFYSRFGRPGDVILSLYDKRSAPWDFWCEKMSAVELAKAMVEVRDGMDGNSKFFQTTGRSVLASLLRISKSQEQLWKLANLPAEDLELILKANNEISHRYLGQGESGQASGVIATALMNLTFLKYLNHHVRTRETETGKKENPFSIRQWVMDDNDERWVFLVATDSHWEDTRSLVRLWFDIASTAVLEREKGPKTQPIWLVCDEISTIGNLPTLPKILDRGYKYAGTLVLGYQSLAQIEQIYGAESSRNIIQGLQNIIVFACNENQLSRELADRLGRYEIEEVDPSLSTGGEKSGGRFTVSVRAKDRLSVTSDEIKSLRENHGFLKLARFPPARISFDYVTFPEVMTKSIRSSEIPAKSWVEMTQESMTMPRKQKHRTTAPDKPETVVDDSEVNEEKATETKQDETSTVTESEEITTAEAAQKSSCNGDLWSTFAKQTETSMTNDPEEVTSGKVADGSVPDDDQSSALMA